MTKREQHAYKSLLISLAIIGIFLVCIIAAQIPNIASNLSEQDNAMAGAQEPIEATIDPNATDEPDEPLEDEVDVVPTVKPTTSPLSTGFSTLTPAPTIATFTPFPTINTEVDQTPTPMPTFAVDIPLETSPTTAPSPKPTSQTQSNIGLIIGGVIGSILLIIGIVWIILSRQKKNNEYTMPAPPSNPEYQSYQSNLMETSHASAPGWTPPNNQPENYTTPYDQYMENNPNNQPK